MNDWNLRLTNVDDVHPSPIGIRIPPPIYLSLRLEGWIVQNCMIDIGIAITIIPKAIANEMKLHITWCIYGFI